MQKVLVTGANGFVGSHVVEKCLENGLEVWAAIRKSSNLDYLKAASVKFTYPDFNNVELLTKEIEEKQYDFIIHIAGITKARFPKEYEQVNALYTANLGRAIKESRHKVKKFVFMSSLGAIGPLQYNDGLITENTIPKPVTAYGKSKLIAEEMLAALHLPLVVLRPTAVYGPREKDIFILLRTISKGFEPYLGKANQHLSFVYVKDLAQLTVDALFNPKTGSYNVTDGNCYNRYEFAQIIKKYLSNKTFKIYIPLTIVNLLAVLTEKGAGLLNKTSVLNKEKLNELTAANWCCDISRLRNEMGYSPQFNLQQGLKETIQWCKTNQWL
ncbi:MAG: NAD(P)-dependent oxidoreductase [Chitinophagaceae bacterium]|nr:NAD(P)-dependent oxidoreductase [Chitinophagaceae bacterium]